MHYTHTHCTRMHAHMHAHMHALAHTRTHHKYALAHSRTHHTQALARTHTHTCTHTPHACTHTHTYTHHTHFSSCWWEPTSVPTLTPAISNSIKLSSPGSELWANCPIKTVARLNRDHKNHTVIPEHCHNTDNMHVKPRCNTRIKYWQRHGTRCISRNLHQNNHCSTPLLQGSKELLMHKATSTDKVLSMRHPIIYGRYQLPLGF